MNPQGRVRISAVELVLLLLVLLIGWAAWHAFRIVREVDQAPLGLASIQREYLEVADGVQKFVGESHESLAKVATHGDRAAWDLFQRRCNEFHTWLEARQSTMTRSKIIMVRPFSLTADIGQVLDEVRRDANAYGLEARRLVTDTGFAPNREAIEEDAERKADELIDVAIRARAQAGAINLFLSGAHSWYSWLRKLMVASLLTLLGLGLWVVLIGYRRVVSPLRRRLGETHAIIERQQKLAHFGELAAVVAHEIRNPLTAIGARLFTLDKALAPGSSERDDAAVIRNEISRLNRIVTDFLATARPSPPVLAPLTPRPLLELVQRLLGPGCAKQGIILDVESAVETSFLGDFQQLSQVLINLVQNAAESIGHDGAIHLRARADHYRLHDKLAEVVVLEVEDTGPGIAPEVQARLFDPFYSTKPTGTGLGLSIAARILDRHCGAIDFRTQVGRGTTFMVLLPLSPPPRS